jgi:hypothetical protein
MDRKLPFVGRWIERRTALEMGLCLALVPRIALAQTDPTRERPREGDVLVAVGATPPEPLKPEALPLAGKQTFTWPMDPATAPCATARGLTRCCCCISILRASIRRPRSIPPTVSSPIQPSVCIPAATSPTGSRIGSCSHAHAITRLTIQRKGPRWSAVQLRAACQHCH